MLARTSRRPSFSLVLLLLTASYITADIYVPSMPAILHAFKATAFEVQSTFSLYFLGFSVSHVFYGPLSDRYGRRFPILVGLAVAIMGAALCLISPSIGFLILGRLLQGVGMGACGCLGRAILRDLFSGEDLAKKGSFVSMLMVFITAAAPIVGGYLQFYFNWKSSFMFIFVYSVLLWTFTLKFFPETNHHLNPKATRLLHVLNNYKILIMNKTFLGYTLCMSLSYAGMLVYVTTAPFLFQTQLKFNSIQFGWLSVIIGGAVFISAYFNSRWVVQKGIPFMTGIGIVLMLTASLVMLGFALLQILNVAVLLVPMIIYALGGGFTFSNAFAGAFTPFPHMAGAAGALFGCSQIFFGSLASILISLCSVDTQLPLGGFWLGLSILVGLAWKFLAIRPNPERVASFSE